MRTAYLLGAVAAATLLASSCKQLDSTFVVLELRPGAATPSRIHSIDVDVVLGGRSASTTFTAQQGGTIALPTDASLQIGAGAGDLSITAHARDAAGALLDTGSGHGSVATGDTVHVVVQFGTAPGDGGTVADGAAGTGGTSSSDGAAGAGGGGGGGAAGSDGSVIDSAGLPPTLDISPAPEDFGPVDVNTLSRVPFTVTNRGSAPTSKVTVALSGAGELTLSGDDCSSSALPAGGQCTFSVIFAPTTYGARTGTVSASATAGGTARSALTAVGRDHVTLTLNLAGSGTGTVSGTGLTCAANTCTGSYPRTTVTNFQTVALSATPDALSTFAGWTAPGCGSTGGCSVTMDAAKTVTATFNVKTIVVNVRAIGLAFQSGAVSSGDGTVSCGGACAISHGAAASFTFVAKPTGTSTFIGWAGGTCKGTNPMCTVPLASDVTVVATFGPRAYMFVTSSTIVPGRLGGVSGADSECATRAGAAGLPGTYRAWISTTGVDANTRVGAGGWVRVDGRPFAQGIASLKAKANQVVAYPPRVDENGNDLGPTQIFVATGSNVDGSNFGAQCGDYTSTAGSLYVGLASAGTASWSYEQLLGGGCASPAHLYCFRTDLGGQVSPGPEQGRFMFISSAPFVPGGGLKAADVLCSSDATTAGLPDNFLALLATAGASAASRFDLAGRPWMRLDSVFVVASAGDLATGNLLAPIDQTADGNYVTPGVWTGARDPASTASDGLACNDWRSPTGAAYFGYPVHGLVPDWFNSGSNLSCSSSGYYLICAEQ